jgi:glucose-1-phosphate adenylyltransferase
MTESIKSIIDNETKRERIINGVRVDEGAYVDGSVIMPGVRVGRGAVIRNAILDKNLIVPEGAQIGVDVDLDRARYTVSDNGIVVLGKGQIVI